MLINQNILPLYSMFGRKPEKAEYPPGALRLSKITSFTPITIKWRPDQKSILYRAANSPDEVTRKIEPNGNEQVVLFYRGDHSDSADCVH